MAYPKNGIKEPTKKDSDSLSWRTAARVAAIAEMNTKRCPTPSLEVVLCRSDLSCTTKDDTVAREDAVIVWVKNCRFFQDWSKTSRKYADANMFIDLGDCGCTLTTNTGSNAMTPKATAKQNQYVLIFISVELDNARVNRGV